MDDSNKRDRVKYNVLFVPDKVAKGVKNFSVDMDKLIIFFAVVVFIIIASLIFGLVENGRYRKANAKIAQLNEQLQMMTDENTNLETENESLQEKVSILSSTVTEKIQQQEQIEAEMAQAYIPSGFPLKGTASYDDEKTELDGNPIAIFYASEGTSVISSASGVVESIEASGGKYVVTIDHENGYKSVYRNGTKPKVTEGEQVTSDTEIFRITTGCEELGYQVIQDDKYIDPLDLMEIYG